MMQELNFHLASPPKGGSLFISKWNKTAIDSIKGSEISKYK
jgi:hypothetical protein